MGDSQPPRTQTSPTKRKRIGSANEKIEQPSTEHYHHAESVEFQTSAIRSTVGINEDIKLRERLVNAMTKAQETQARACGNLIVLTDKLHDWARDLDEQERWLRGERHRLIEQQQALTKTHLDIATGCIEQLGDRCDDASKHTDTELVQQYKSMVAVLEGNIEVLISELQIEKEAREAAEGKLREKLREEEDSGSPRWIVTCAPSTSPS